MKTTVRLEGLNFYAYHGFYTEEQKIGNQFEINASVDLKSFDSFDDNIEDTVNYEEIYKIIAEEMENTQKLIETVAFNIIVRLKELENITGAQVGIAKKNPKIGGNASAAVVEMKF